MLSTKDKAAISAKAIPIKDICLDGKIQQRPVDDNVVKRYAAMMKEGSRFPPVEIITDNKSNFLWDGFHRVAAARKNGKKYIETNIVNGTQRQAVWLSFSANKENAFPRQPGTAKEIIVKILKDKEWAKMAARDIANHVGVTERYVFKIQSALKTYPMNSSEDKPDSKPEKQLFRADTRNVKRGGSEYEMKKPAKKVLDSTSRQVPEHLVKFFERANEYRQMIKQLNDMLKTIREGKEAGDLFYKYIKIENLSADINNVKRIFRFAMPYSVCPYCMANENNDECRACTGCGFVNEATYLAAPKDLK